MAVTKFKHTHSISVDPSGGSIKNTVIAEGDTSIFINKTVADGQTVFPIDLAFLVAKVKSLVISVTGEVTINTNDGGTPDETITIATMYRYVTGEGVDFHFSTDVTGLFIANASGSDVDISIRILLDG